MAGWRETKTLKPINISVNDFRNGLMAEFVHMIVVVWEGDILNFVALSEGPACPCRKSR